MNHPQVWVIVKVESESNIASVENVKISRASFQPTLRIFEQTWSAFSVASAAMIPDHNNRGLWKFCQYFTHADIQVVYFCRSITVEAEEVLSRIDDKQGIV